MIRTTHGRDGRGADLARPVSCEPSSKIESLALIFDDTGTPVPKDPTKPGIYNTAQSMLDNQRKLAIGIRERFGKRLRAGATRFTSRPQGRHMARR